MANSDLIMRMENILDDYEAGRISPERAGQSLESHMQALEGIGLASVHQIRTFAHRLLAAHLSDGEQEFKDDERVATVLAELRSFLRTLPVA